ncbi:MAG: hypothetical protein ACI91B_002176 [Planctomycetota bacterium]|jgi:hypothetical protein
MLPRMRTSPISITVLAVLCAAATAQSRESVVQLHADGTPHEQYTVDAEGKRHGTYRCYEPPGVLVMQAVYRHGELHGNCEQSWDNGKPKLRGSYREGKLHGKVEHSSADGSHVREVTYRKGVEHGRVRIRRDGKVVSKQTWSDGALADLDGLEPFSRSRNELRKALASIDRKDPGAKAPLKERRDATLHRLMAYRYLCHVPHEGLSLVEEWNELCTAAAEVVHQNGKLSHTPPKPSGMSDERYRQGARGAGSSNLAGGGGMVRSIDSYMDDSDSSNIDRVGHRRWCLNPVLKKTGFGESGGYSAMWSFDSSGKRPRGVDVVMYPPPGFVPVDYFGARHAWSIAPLKGGTPKLEALKITVLELDDDYVVTGEALPIDHLGITTAGQGTGASIVFRPKGLRVATGSRYLIEVRDAPRGKPRYRYLVEFCDAIKER